jgi:hypothetical protein
MYANAKIIPVETDSGDRGGGMEENSEEENSNMICCKYHMICMKGCKNLCKCYNVPKPSTIEKKKEWKKIKLAKLGMEFVLFQGY